MPPIIPPEDFQPPGMVGATAGQEAMAGAMDIGVSGTQTVAQTINQQLADRATISGKMAGAQAGSRIDPNTRELLPIENLPSADSISIYDQAFRTQALQTYANVAIAQYGAFAETSAANHPGDPAGLKADLDGYSQKLIGNAQPMAVGLIQPDVVALNARYMGQAVTQQVDYARKGNLQAWTTANTLRDNNTQADLNNLITAQSKAGVFDPGKTEAKAAETINGNIQAYNSNLDITARIHHELQPQVDQMKLDHTKMLWSGFFKGQAASFADREIPVGGQYKPDTDGANKYLANPDVNGIIPPDLFSQDEWGKIKSDGLAIFNQAVGNNTQKYVTDTQNAEANLTTQYNGMQGQADQLFAQAKLSRDYTAYNAYLDSLDKQQPTLSLDAGTQADRMDKLIRANRQKMFDYQTELRNLNIDQTLGSANSTEVNSAHPYTLPSGAGLKNALALQQYRADQRSANPDHMVHASDDPKEFERLALDDQAGWVWHGGRMLPRIQSEFENFSPSADPKQNANILENYHRLLADPFAAQLVTPEMSATMSRWERASTTKDPLETFKTLTVAASNTNAEFETGNENAALKKAKAYAADPGLATKELSDVSHSAVSESGFFPTLWRDVWGLPTPSSVTAVEGNFRPGIVSFALGLAGMSDSDKQSMGIPPSGDINVIFDGQTEKAFGANVVSALQNGVSEQNGSAQNQAFGQLGAADFYMSRLLYSDKLLEANDTKAGAAGSYVVGKYAPEAELGLPSYTVAEKLSMDLTQQAGDLFKGVTNEQMTTRGWVGANIAPPGSPDFLYVQWKAGNLRLEAHMSSDGHVEYTPLLRAQTQGGDQYIPLLPKGQYWRYNMSSEGDTAQQIKSAQVGGKVGDYVENYFGNNQIGRVAGQAAAGVTAWKAERDAVNEKIDEARKAWANRPGVFSRLDTATPQQ
jgi:hypothetical protein